MHISCRLRFFRTACKKLVWGNGNLNSNMEGQTDPKELFSKGEDLRCTLHEVTETLHCWARSSPSKTRVSSIKLPLFSYANSRHFSNTVKFNLCSTLQCFGKLQLWVGARICERCVPCVNLERATFIYTHQQGLVNFPCRVILVCYHKSVSCWDISVNWGEDAFLGRSDTGTDQWASHFEGF